MAVQCPECSGSGYVHLALYDPNAYPSAVQSGDHRKWAAQNKPAATSKHATTCRVCWGKKNLG